MSVSPLNVQTSFFDVQQVFEWMLNSRPDAIETDPNLARFFFFREEIWPRLLEVRPQLMEMYDPTNGRPATEPVRLLAVMILQFMEGLPDRQAAAASQYDLRWKAALHMEVDERSFHSTTLVKFRNRLEEHGLERLGFEAVLACLQKAGYLGKQAKQRLDSTHILAQVRKMSRLERIRETLRLALEELDACEEKPESWGKWKERYVESEFRYQGMEMNVLQEKLTAAGQDARDVLAWIKTLPSTTRSGKYAQLLDRVFGEMYEITEDDNPTVIRKQASGGVINPHDPDAQYSTKSATDKSKQWVGFKVQIAETVQDEPRETGEPTKNLITGVVTQSAPESDEAGMREMLAAQKTDGLDKPSTLYVDGAYISGNELKRASDEERTLMGPAPRAPRRGKQFSSDAFDIDTERRRAICPGQKMNTQCSRLEEKSSGNVAYRFEWSTHCHACELAANCIGRNQRHRTLVVQEHHNLTQARRREMTTDAFRTEMKRRNGVEGTISELVRGYGLRRSRYRGKEKMGLQNYLIAAACNIKRIVRRRAWERCRPRGPTGQEIALASG